MKGFKKPAGTGQRQSFANGGMVRGSGSGTSDSIKTAVPEGSYIMPADSTQAIGPDNLAGMGFKPGAKAAPAPTTDAPAMGFKPGSVPVNLSDGEFKLSPDQVHAIGAQVLEGLKAATHTPAAQQEREEPGEKETPEPSRNELYFADGGVVEDEKKKAPPLATSPSNTYPGNQAEAAGNIYAKSNAEAADFAKAAFPGTATAIQGAGQAIQDAYNQGGIGAAVGQGFRGAMVPAVGLADDVMSSAAKVLNPAAQALKTLVTGDATPIGQAAAAAPPSAKPAQPAAAPTPAASAAPSAAPANPNYGNEPNAPAAPQAAPTALANNVTREGNSYSGKDIGPGFTVNGKEPGGGFVSGAAQPGGFSQGVGGPEVLGILQRENQIRAGMAPLMDQIRFNEGTRGNGNYFGFRRPSGDEGGPAVLRDPSTEGQAERERSAVMQAAMTPLRGSPNGQLTANQLRTAQGLVDGSQRDATARYQTDTSAATQRDTAAMREDGEAARSFEREQGANQRARAANQIQQQEMGLRREAQGFQTREAQRKESLQARYEAAKTPEERAAIAQQIRDLSGKQEPQNRFTVVPGGQEWDAASGAMRNVPARVLNNQTGQFVDGERQAGAQPQAMPTDKSKLAAGQIYQTARGPARWDGNQFVGV